MHRSYWGFFDRENESVKVEISEEKHLENLLARRVSKRRELSSVHAPLLIRLICLIHHETNRTSHATGRSSRGRRASPSGAHSTGTGGKGRRRQGRWEGSRVAGGDVHQLPSRVHRRWRRGGGVPVPGVALHGAFRILYLLICPTCIQPPHFTFLTLGRPPRCPALSVQ